MNNNIRTKANVCMKLLALIIVLTIANTAWATVNLEPNCVLQLKMNDNVASTVVIDSRGFSNGTAQQNTSILHTAGKIGGALSFNGTIDYVDSGNTFQSVFQNSFSISMYVKPNAGLPSSVQDLFGTTEGDRGNIWLDFSDYEVRVAYSTYFPFEPLVIEPFWNNGIQDWTLLIATFENINNTSVIIKLYVNGVLSGTKETIDNMSELNVQFNMLIGWTNNSSGYNMFSGSIDNVCIFNKALSPEEIVILWNGGNGREDFSFYNQVNQNPDCRIAFIDFALFADDWQKTEPNLASDFDGSGTVDIYDLDIFCDYWLTGFENASPVVQGESFILKKNESRTFNINATDASPLFYTVESLPTKGAVYDSANTLITSVPYHLPNATIKYTAGDYNDVCDSFTFAADDNTGYAIPCGGKVTGTATVVIVGQYPPVASDVNINAYTYIVCPITLIATDDNLPSPPGRLKYVITSLPNDVNAYLQDPVSGGQSRIDANNLPYKLSSWGNTVWFATSTVGVADFNFKAYDGNTYSNTKRVDVNVIANLKDCLSFDGNGVVNIPDTGNYFDIEPNRGVGVCFATRQPFCTLFKKWSVGKGGYEVGLIGGFISARVYDNNGTKIAEQKSDYRYDNGLWANLVIRFNSVAGRLELHTGFGNSFPTEPNWFLNGEHFEDAAAASFPVNIWPVGNDCNLVVGTGYKYEIDAIRAYSLLASDGFRSLASIQVRTVAGDTSTYVPTPKARFKCNYDGTNNTTTQIYDDNSVTHLVGTINDPNHVRYYPFFWHWYDSAAMQQGVR